MQNRASIFRFAVACVLCFAIIGYSFYAFLFGEPSSISPIAAATGASDGEKKTAEGKASSEESPVESTPEISEEAAGTGASLPAGASGTVMGKVITSYYSPYAAKDSYNNTYVKNSSGLTLDIKALLKESLGFKIQRGEQPQVLIMHTHTTECFMTEDRDYYTDADLTRTLDEQYNIVRVGNTVTEKLNAAGINTVHATELHDYPEYNGSYTRAAATIGAYLKKHPEIKVVIDLHRDAIQSGESDKVKPVAEINGKKAAQIMIVMGSQSGSVTNFPNWQENFKLALRLQQTVEVMYPTLARPLSLVSRNYNESLTTGSMLIEIGTDANTIDEAVYSGELLADALVSLLNTLQ